MNTGAALRSVKAQAGAGIGVVGGGRASVVVDGGVGLARGDDVDAAGGEQ